VAAVAAAAKSEAACFDSRAICAKFVAVNYSTLLPPTMNESSRLKKCVRPGILRFTSLDMPSRMFCARLPSILIAFTTHFCSVFILTI
jgi:hypothetical protein